MANHTGLKSFGLTYIQCFIYNLFSEIFHSPSRKVTFKIASLEKGDFIFLCVTSMACMDLQMPHPVMSSVLLKNPKAPPCTSTTQSFIDHTLPLRSIPVHSGISYPYGKDMFILNLLKKIIIIKIQYNTIQ